MTPEAQRIAIAKACEWRKDGMGWWFQEKEPRLPQRFLPDYLNDLNAMHESLAGQSERFRAEFDGQLILLATKSARKLCELTAKDWADCFIIVLQSKQNGGN